MITGHASRCAVPLSVGGGDVVGVVAVDGGVGGVVDHVGVVQPDGGGAGQGGECRPGVALRVEDWVSERQESLAVLAHALSGRLATDQTRSALGAVDHTYDEFSLIELTDLTGKVLASSRDGAGIDVGRAGLVQAAAGGQPVMTSLVRQGDHIQWIVAQPVMDRSGRPAAC